MLLNEFIFSNKTSIRLTRHLVFWGTEGICFWLQSLMPESVDDLTNYQPYKNAFIGLACFQPCCILCVYACIYWILPRYLNKQEFITGLLAFIPLFLISFFINYIAGILFFDFVVFNNLSQADWLEIMTGQGVPSVVMIAFNNLCWAMSIAAIALGIKYSKNWYLQQQENLELIRKKTRDEIQYQKAQIQPAYLARTLKCIYDNIQSDVTNAPTIVLKLSELLSYSLYESRDKLVPLEKELKALRGFVYLEQVRKNSPYKIELNVLGPIKSASIPPMLILSIVQDILATLDEPQFNFWQATVTIRLEYDVLLIQLSFKEMSNNPERDTDWEFIFLKVKQRLESLLTPEDYNIQLSRYEKVNNLFLRLNLRRLNILKFNKRGELYESA